VLAAPVPVRAGVAVTLPDALLAAMPLPVQAAARQATAATIVPRTMSLPRCRVRSDRMPDAAPRTLAIPAHLTCDSSKLLL
jgi:hypothetical protein